MSGPDESDETRAAREAYEDAFNEGKGFAEREIDRLRTENERLLGAVQRAYGYLWHVNNEPGAPNQYAPEQAAYAARRELRELLTHEQRGEGINAARAALAEAKS